MPLGSATGILDVTNATLRSKKLVATEDITTADLNVSGTFSVSGTPVTFVTPWTVSNSNIYYEANVAIGTNSVTSGARLEVDGRLQLSNASTDVTLTSIAGSAGGFSQQAQLLHPNPVADPNYPSQKTDLYLGTGVAISEDGTYAIAGAPGDYRMIAGNGVGRGSAVIYLRSGTSWSSQQTITASDAADNDNFGYDVAINRDGTYVVVGAYRKNSEAGAAYVFTRSGTTWSQQQKIAPSGSGYLTRGGLRFDSDANTLVMGALKYNGWAGAAYVWTRSGTTWSQQQQFTGNDTAAYDNFGHGADITADGNMIIIGAGYHDSPTNNEGAAYIFTRSGTTWSQQAKLQANDKQNGDQFAGRVAIDEDGTRAVMGALGVDTNGNNAGAAYIFKRSGTSWSQEAKIQPTDVNATDFAGSDVDITDDGSTVILSSPWAENKSNTNMTYVGYLYVFTRSGTTWTQLQRLGPQVASASDYFGNCIRIARNGSYIIGGNQYDDAPNGWNTTPYTAGAGAAYIFYGTAHAPDRLNVSKGVTAQGDIQVTDGTSNNVTLSVTSSTSFDWSTPTTWSTYATGSTLLTSGHANSDAMHFGQNVDISSDGTYAVVGASASAVSGGDQHVYVYIRTGTTWTQQAKLTSNDIAADDSFGIGVRINKDGSYLVVSAQGEDSGATNGGSLYVFTRSGTTWTQQQKFWPSDINANEWSGGYALAINHAGDRVVVGAIVHPTPNYRGAAYVFTRSGTTWSQEAKLTASDGNNSDEFGSFVAISGDGATIVVGAQADDDSTRNNHGSAYVFTRSGTTWTEQQKLEAPTKIAEEFFGFSVAIAGDNINTIAIGARGQTNYTAGAVYVFTRYGTTWSLQQRFQSSDTHQADYFGGCVDISSDGNTIAVGAYQQNHSSATALGAVYVFTRTGTTWSQKMKLEDTGGGAYGLFGYSTHISEDGRHIIVGAYNYGTPGYRGKAFIYTASTGADPAQLSVNSDLIVNHRNVIADLFTSDNEWGAMIIPVGVSHQRPSTAVLGMLRYNSTLNTPEIYMSENGASGWGEIQTVLPLYAFTTHTFTPAGATGRTGPTLTQCRNAYNTAWDTDTSFFNITTQGIQIWTVPKTATYEIEVAGGHGGSLTGTYSGNWGLGGDGGWCKGTIDLVKGVKLALIVGQAGLGGTSGWEGYGGGGASWVLSENLATLHAVAGGGGGANGPVYGVWTNPTLSPSAGYNYFNGSVAYGGDGGSSQGSSSDTAGGAQGNYANGGGAGFTSDGAGDRSGTSTQCGGSTPANGAIGGETAATGTPAPGSYNNGKGGFGGGGGNGWHSGGGGGGYAGGDGGDLGCAACRPVGGGGGTTYSNLNGTTFSTHTAQDGYIKITMM